ncbi:MAG: hypothetical protein Q4E28_04730 [Clostridia bacterium]|nr:hypothetical protein [Clostridia bacterium]
MELELINSMATKSPDELVENSEKTFENRLESIVDNIGEKIKIILLAGPSSSGKTTSSKLLTQMLRDKNKSSFVISLDDFYKNRQDIPADKNGEQDFETVDALDLVLLEHTLSDIMNYKTTKIPIFDFKKGARSTECMEISPHKDDIFIIEGLHALNPKITSLVPKTALLKLYISVDTGIENKNENLFTGRQIRFIRRMLRDFTHRSAHANLTFKMWESVRAGEDKYLYPYKYEADEFINSFHPYEICIYKNRALDMLNEPETKSTYAVKSQFLISGLNLCQSLDEKYVPENSLLKEFIG